MNRRAVLFLLLYLAAILYLSFYPWRLVPSHGLKVLRWIPVISRFVVLDAILNLLFYIPLGAAAFVSIRRRATFAFIGALAFGSLVSLTVECTQLYIPTRVSSLNDLLFNSIGTLLGVAIAALVTSPPVASRVRSLHLPRVLLLGLWALWQAFVFLPHYGPAMDINQVVVALLLLILVVIPWQHWTITALLLAWLAIGELQPFHFLDQPKPFLWVPFQSWFAGAPESYYSILFEKLFLFTAILWMERKAGFRWIWALVLPGLILAAGEFAQCYLPGRTPESTDLVLLAAGAVLLHLAEPHNKDSA